MGNEVDFLPLRQIQKFSTNTSLQYLKENVKDEDSADNHQRL